MSTENLTNDSQSEMAEIAFPGNDQLSKAVVAGTLRYYIGEYGLFVLFLMAETIGFSVCYARGVDGKEPNGESFERLMTLRTLDEARSVLVKMQELASAALKPTATDTNA